MPVSGLPGNLELMLGTVVEKCIVKNWQIYEEKGGISFKIKFTNADSNELLTEHKNVCYMRKPTSKSNRDHRRAEQFNAPRRVTRSSTSKVAEKEMPRQDITGEGLLTGHFVSPVKVCDPVIDSPASGPHNNTPGQACSTPMTSMINNTNINHTSLTSQSISTEIEEGCDTSKESDSDNESELEIDRDDPVDSTTTPCHFSADPDHDDSFKGIRKLCTAPDCGIYICHGCFLSHKHGHHQEWIRFRLKRKHKAK